MVVGVGSFVVGGPEKREMQSNFFDASSRSALLRFGKPTFFCL